MLKRLMLLGFLLVALVVTAVPANAARWACHAFDWQFPPGIVYYECTSESACEQELAIRCVAECEDFLMVYDDDSCQGDYGFCYCKPAG